jgi:hypothetical protein
MWHGICYGDDLWKWRKGKTVENRKWPVTQKCRNKKSTLRQNVENLIWTGLGCLEAIIIKKLLVFHNNTSTLTIYYNRTTKFQKIEQIWKKPKLIHYF